MKLEFEKVKMNLTWKEIYAAMIFLLLVTGYIRWESVVILFESLKEIKS
ncbi:MAG: hypothetical protein ACI86P_001452 [Flavobacteriales bacterium]|jgi:hypothetical protein